MAIHRTESEIDAEDIKKTPPVRTRTRPSDPKTTVDTDAGSTGKPAEYEVGYRKPPKHTRFKPGKSGNPRGRPKGAKGLKTLVRETLTKKVTVRTGSGQRKISQIEAALLKTAELAMKGNLRALAELIKLYGNAVPEANEEIERQASQEELTATDLAILEELRRQLANKQET